MKVVVEFILIIFIFPVLVYSQAKIGYVDSKIIIESIQDAKDAQTNLDNLVQQWKGELQLLNDSLDLLKEDYEKKKLILTEKVRGQKEDEIKVMEKKIS